MLRQEHGREHIEGNYDTDINHPTNQTTDGRTDGFTGKLYFNKVDLTWRAYIYMPEYREYERDRYVGTNKIKNYRRLLFNSIYWEGGVLIIE